jgi:hypothetical protein
MALGSLIIQKQLGFSDRELVEEITENPYLQFFIGLPGYNCKDKGIRLSGPGLGCHRKDASIDRKIEYIDNADRVEVERSQPSKRCHGLGKIVTRLEETTDCLIVLSILPMNIDRLT